MSLVQELEHTAATLAAMDVSDEVLKDAKTEFQGQRASHKRWVRKANPLSGNLEGFGFL